jgi:protein-disulfide isomerase
MSATQDPPAATPPPAGPPGDSQRKRRLAVLGGVLVAAVVVVVLVVALSGGGGSSGGGALTSPKPAAKSAAPVPGPPVVGAAEVAALMKGIPQHGITLGKASAPVTLVEYADLKCPICAQYSLTVLPQLIPRYVRTGKVKIVFRAQHFIGEQEVPGDALAAARMAEAVGLQNKLWTFAELFYANQGGELQRYVTDAFLRRIGSAVPGLDVAKALAQRSSPAVAAQVAQGTALFDRYRFTGTPSFQLSRTGAPPRTFAPSSFDLSAFAGPIDALLKQ